MHSLKAERISLTFVPTVYNKVPHFYLMIKILDDKINKMYTILMSYSQKRDPSNTS